MGRRSGKAIPLETAEQAAVVAMMDSVGFCVYQLNQERETRQTAGLYDLYAVHPVAGLAVWFDVKRIQGGDTSAAQELFAEIHDAARRSWLGKVEPMHGLPVTRIGSRLEAETFLVRYGLAEGAAGHGITLRPRRSELWVRWHAVQREVKEAARQRRRRRRTHPGGRSE